ncbi:hypothetical protein SLE2022_082920 [Rubroshorea leprosula]
MKPVNRTLNEGHVWKVRARWFQGLRKIDWITYRSRKSFKGKYVRVASTLEHVFASGSEEGKDSTRPQNFLWKKLHAFCMFSRLYTVVSNVIGATSASLLPVQTIGDLSPTLFVGIWKALVAAILMNINVAGLNQLSDVEIDKINKPHYPLASGDLSIETGIAITFGACSMSLGMGIMSSPPLFFGLFIYFLAGSAYSINLPFLRRKKDPFLAAKYVLGKPMVVTKSLVFATAFADFFSVVLALFKDIPDVQGDKAFGIQTLSVKLGEENVFWLCVNMILLAYGAAMVVGATSSSRLSRLITITGHSLLASLMVFRVQSIDLTNKASLHAEFFLIPFVR